MAKCENKASCMEEAEFTLKAGGSIDVCPGCAISLIVRDGYELDDFSVIDDENVIDSMPAKEWLEAMTMD